MKILTELLERFSKALNKNTLLKEEVQSVIKAKTGKTPESINIKDGVLEIVGTPALKNEIMLKETQILTELKGISKILYK